MQLDETLRQIEKFGVRLYRLGVLERPQKRVFRIVVVFRKDSEFSILAVSQHFARSAQLHVDGFGNIGRGTVPAKFRPGFSRLGKGEEGLFVSVPILGFQVPSFERGRLGIEFRRDGFADSRQCGNVDVPFEGKIPGNAPGERRERLVLGACALQLLEQFRLSGFIDGIEA